MVTVDVHQGLQFRVHLPQAAQVEIVGSFHGWHESTYPMHRDDAGMWTATIDPGPGAFLFRYRIDGRGWMLDPDDHGRATGADGAIKSRAYRPPRELDPDHLAA